MNIIEAQGPLAARAGFNHADRGHVVQFYQEDSGMLDSLSRFIGASVGGGGAALVIATPEHRESLERRLRELGLEVPRAAGQGRYLALDAAGTLSLFMRNGWPDESLFAGVIASAMESALASVRGGDRRVFAFGEMVALLYSKGRAEAAIRVERLWNDLAKAYSFSLLCAYSMKNFQTAADEENFRALCAEHTGVIPMENHLVVESEEERLRNVAHLQQRALMLEQLSKTYEELRQSEEKYRLMVECMKDYSIFMLSTEGNVLSWNQGAEKINGYSQTEIVGRHFSIFYSAEEAQSGKPDRELRIAAEEGRFEDVGWRLRKDGSRFWANVVIAPLRDPAGELKGFAKITRDITERRKAEAAIRDLSGRLLHAQDEARRHLARELHDSAAQSLSALSLNLALLGTVPAVAGSAKAGKTLAESARLVDDAAREIRTFSYLLHPPALDDATLGSALRWYTDGFAQRTRIHVEFELSPGLERLPDEVEGALFRVVQEALTNVYRHAGSKRAGVRLALRHSEIVLEVWDEGIGFPPEMLEGGESGPAKLGVGIRGMRERLEQLGGRLEIRGGNPGTRVTAIVPVQTESDS